MLVLVKEQAGIEEESAIYSFLDYNFYSSYRYLSNFRNFLFLFPSKKKIVKENRYYIYGSFFLQWAMYVLGTISPSSNFLY